MKSTAIKLGRLFEALHFEIYGKRHGEDCEHCQQSKLKAADRVAEVTE